MHGLETDRDFQLRSNQIAKPDTLVVAELRMVLDDHGLEGTHDPRDGGPVFPRDCLWVEEVAAVVQLDVPCGRKPFEGILDLCRDGSNWHAFVGRVFPQVAEHAAKRTLAIRQEDRGDVFNLAVRCAFGFDQKRVGTCRIDGVLLASSLQDFCRPDPVIHWLSLPDESGSANIR